MAATTVDRNSPALHIERPMKVPLKAGSVIPAGVMVCVDATGLAVNASDTAGLSIVGRSAHAASYAAGDRFIVVERGVFYFGNDGTINVTHANTGVLAMILDNQTLTLAATAVNDIGVGYIESVDAVFGVAVSILGGKPSAA